MIGIAIAESPTVAYEIAVNCLIQPSLLSHHLSVAGAGYRVTSQRAMQANGRASLKVPTPCLIPGGLVRVDPGWAYLDKVSGEWTFQCAIAESAEIHSVTDLQGTQVPITRKFLIKSAASETVNTAVHFMLYERAQILIRVSALWPQITPEAVSARDGFILKEAVPPFVTDRAVVWVMEHEPLDDIFAKRHGLFVRGGNHHALLGIYHTAHLHAFDGPL
jgi:hypothetical protein